MHARREQFAFVQRQRHDACKRGISLVPRPSRSSLGIPVDTCRPPWCRNRREVPASCKEKTMLKHPARLVPWLGVVLFSGVLWSSASAQTLEVVDVEGQPLAGNVRRLMDALDYLGAPLAADETKAILAAVDAQDPAKLQKLLDPHVLVQVTVNPESRVKVKRGPADAVLQQGGYTPVLIKVINEGGVTKVLRMASPQARPIYSGGFANKIAREGVKVTKDDIKDRFLAGGKEPYGELEIFNKPPMTDKLSGLKVEYALALLH